MTPDNQKCIILLSFIEEWTKEYIRTAVRNCAYLICADGGEAVARTVGLLPDCVIGDFDSDPSTERFSCLYITYPAEKDLTDCEAAILHAVSLGYTDITVIGGINGRLDHTIGNIAMLLKFHGQLNHLEFCDMHNAMLLLSGGAVTLYPSPYYKYFSLASIDAVAEGITVTGAKYPLQDAVLPRDTSLGISNEITGPSAEISVQRGILLVMRSSDHR